MEIYRNKSSGKFFIYIQDTDTKRIELVTPDGKIKILEKRFFDNHVEREENYLLKQGLITELQINRYQYHTTYREQDKENKLKRWVAENFTPNELDKFLKHFEDKIKKEDRLSY